VEHADVDGVRLAYQVTGEPDAPPMILLHGLGSGAGSWNTVAAQLAQTHRVYALYLRGHGHSDWPGKYTLELMRDDVLGFLDALALDRVVLIGHSMGGNVALLLAEEYPRRLSRVIIEDSLIPVPGGDAVPLPPRRFGPQAYDWQLAEAILAQLNAPDPAWWDKLADITIPVLLIAGGPASPAPQDLIIKAAERIPGCVLTTIPVGHAIHRDRPADFLAAVRGFLG
jgi:pimeloyl-ACP methyl ester carboxylesterase